MEKEEEEEGEEAEGKSRVDFSKFRGLVCLPARFLLSLLAYGEDCMVWYTIVWNGISQLGGMLRGFARDNDSDWVELG